MRKNLNPFLLIIAYLCITSCSVRHNDLKKLNLNGKVKSIKTTSFEAIGKSGNIIKGKEQSISELNESDNEYQYVLLNEKGMITESLFNILYPKAGAKVRNFIKYNDKGLIAEKSEFEVCDVDNSKREKITTFTYNDKDSLIEEKEVWDFSEDNNSIITKSYKYDKNGHKIEEKTISQSIAKFSKQIISNNESVTNYKFDDYGSKIEESSNSNKTTYKYNDKKELIEKQEYNIYSGGNLSLICIYTYKYNSKNEMIEEQYNNILSSTNSTSTFKYNEKGDLIDCTSKNAEGKLESWTTYNYDENGFITERVRFDSTHEKNYKESYKYDYDSHKNWIKKIRLVNDEPRDIEEREIVYY